MLPKLLVAGSNPVARSNAQACSRATLRAPRDETPPPFVHQVRFRRGGRKTLECVTLLMIVRGHFDGGGA
jgi:hypothetical protein